MIVRGRVLQEVDHRRYLHTLSSTRTRSPDGVNSTVPLLTKGEPLTAENVPLLVLYQRACTALGASADMSTVKAPPLLQIIAKLPSLASAGQIRLVRPQDQKSRAMHRLSAATSTRKTL